MPDPAAERWACVACGLLFSETDVAKSPGRRCPQCGGELRNWMGSNRAMFIIGGFVVLPLIGRALVEISKVLGIASSSWLLGAFFVVPAVIAIVGTTELLFGYLLRLPMVRRGGMQALLLIAGFGLAMSIVMVLGLFSEMSGVE